MEGYDFTRGDLDELLVRRFYPERTVRESGVIRDWLVLHGAEYDRLSLSVRVGSGPPIDPSLPSGIQRSVYFTWRKRIDVLAWQGPQPTIVEAKERITPGTIGQLLTYRQLLLEEMPDAPEPLLVAIGRYSDPDTLRALTTAGITVHLYPAEVGSGSAATSGL